MQESPVFFTSNHAPTHDPVGWGRGVTFECVVALVWIGRTSGRTFSSGPSAPHSGAPFCGMTGESTVVVAVRSLGSAPHPLPVGKAEMAK